LPVAKSREMGPRFSGICRFVNSVTHRKVGARQSLATRYVNDVRIRGSHRNRPDRLRPLRVKNCGPRPPKIIRLPNATIYRPYIENIRLARHSTSGTRPPAARWPNHAPPQLLVRTVGILLRLTGHCAKKSARNGERDQEDSTPSNHRTPQRKISSAPHLATPAAGFCSSDFDTRWVCFIPTNCRSTMNPVQAKLNPAR
jgi:hypothetical protein